MQTLLLTLIALGMTSTVVAWNNGPKGNTATNSKAECFSIPYGTHDWIADHAVDLLPQFQKNWMLAHRAVYLLGTEAPDHKLLPLSCGIPHRGYDDRSQDHSVEWNATATRMINDRAAVRAQQEFSKAVIAFEQGKHAHSVFYLGAMAHYIGDCAQYGHNYRAEKNHGNYEAWAAALTSSILASTFKHYIDPDTLVRRTAYTATRRVSHAVFVGRGDILPAPKMDLLFAPESPEFLTPEFLNSVGESLNLAVNELADVLHTFFVNVSDGG